MYIIERKFDPCFKNIVPSPPLFSVHPPNDANCSYSLIPGSSDTASTDKDDALEIRTIAVGGTLVETPVRSRRVEELCQAPASPEPGITCAIWGVALARFFVLMHRSFLLIMF